MAAWKGKANHAKVQFSQKLKHDSTKLFKDLKKKKILFIYF